MYIGKHEKKQRKNKMLNDTNLTFKEVKALKAETSYYAEVRKIEALQARINKMKEKSEHSKKVYHYLLFDACTSRK